MSACNRAVVAMASMIPFGTVVMSREWLDWDWGARMGVLDLITAAVAMAASLIGVFVAADQLSAGSRERRLVAFIHEAEREVADPVMDSVRRSLLARAVARHAVPAKSVILPAVMVLTCWWLVWSVFYDLDQDPYQELTFLGILLICVVSTAGAVLALALWHHERARVVQALERGDEKVRDCTGVLAVQAVSFGRGVWKLALFSPLVSGAVAVWAAVFGGHWDTLWLLVAVGLLLAAVFFSLSYFRGLRTAPLTEPEVHQHIRPTWVHPPEPVSLLEPDALPELLTTEQKNSGSTV